MRRLIWVFISSLLLINLFGCSELDDSIKEGLNETKIDEALDSIKETINIPLDERNWLEDLLGDFPE